MSRRAAVIRTRIDGIIKETVSGTICQAHNEPVIGNIVFIFPRTPFDGNAHACSANKHLPWAYSRNRFWQEAGVSNREIAHLCSHFPLSDFSVLLNDCSLQMALLEDELKERMRVKPEKLTDLPVEVLINVIKEVRIFFSGFKSILLFQVDEDNIGTVPQICKLMRDIFKEFEHEFVPPAGFRRFPNIKLTLTEERSELELCEINNSRASRLTIRNPSFSCLRRCLQCFMRLELFIFVDPLPDYLIQGTEQFNLLKEFLLRDKCFTKEVIMMRPELDYIFGNVLNLFPDQTAYSLRIDVRNLRWEPGLSFRKKVSRYQKSCFKRFLSDTSSRIGW